MISIWKLCSLNWSSGTTKLTCRCPDFLRAETIAQQRDFHQLPIPTALGKWAGEPCRWFSTVGQRKERASEAMTNRMQSHTDTSPGGGARQLAMMGFGMRRIANMTGPGHGSGG